MKFHFKITSAFFSRFSSEWLQRSTMWSTTQLDKMKLYLKACVPRGSSLFLKKQRCCMLIFFSCHGIHLGWTTSTKLIVNTLCFQGVWCPQIAQCQPGPVLAQFWSGNLTGTVFASPSVLAFRASRDRRG